MTQTVPATCVLGPGKTGLTIGLRVLNLDGTEYAAYSATGVTETSIAGTYRKAGGVVAPLAGGYIVWGTALVDYAEATVESASANVTTWAGVAITSNEVVAMNRLYDMIDSALGVKSFNAVALQNVKNAIGLAAANLDTQLAALPTAEENADAVWDELLSGHTIPGSAGAAGDPWSTALPGAYGAGTAGALLAGIDGNVDAIQAKTDLITAGGSVTVVAPVAASGDVTVYQGDDYANVDGRALDWSGTTWPDLTAATILFLVRAQTGAAFSKAGTVVSAGGATQTVRVELTDDETALLEAWPAESELRIRATLASGGKATIVDSTLSVIEDVV